MRRDHREGLALFEREARLRGRSASHRAFLLGTARRFLASVARCALGKITRGDVEHYLARRGAAAGRGASMPAREYRALDVFFALLEENEVIESRPTAGLVVHEPGAAAPVLLSEDAVARMLAASLEAPAGYAAVGRRLPWWSRPVALRNRALLELLYAVGLRDSEARAALVLDLDLDDASILVRAAKAGRQRRVPLPRRALEWIATYLHEARPALAGAAGAARPARGVAGNLLLSMWGTALSQGSSFGIVRRAAERAGVRAHPHAFRRALATHLIRHDVSVPAVQQLLGHRSIATTARYLELGREDLRRTVALLERETPGENAAAAPSSGQTNETGAAAGAAPTNAPTGAEES